MPRRRKGQITEFHPPGPEIRRLLREEKLTVAQIVEHLRKRGYTQDQLSYQQVYNTVRWINEND